MRRPPAGLPIWGAILWALFAAHAEIPPKSAMGNSLRHVSLRHVREIRALNETKAGQRRPVRLRGVVTALSGWKNSFFFEEGGSGISVDRNDEAVVAAGDLVEIEGRTGAGLFAPLVLADHVKNLGRLRLSDPRSVTYADMEAGKLDGQRVEIRGVVHSAVVEESWGRSVLLLHVQMRGGSVSARIREFSGQDFRKLIDAEVTIAGVCGTVFNDKRQFIGLRLFVPQLENVKVNRTPLPDPFAIPETSIKSLFQFGSLPLLRHLVHVSGTLTYQNPGHAMYLQSAGEAIEVQTDEPQKFSLGSKIEAVGFVASWAYGPTLKHASIRMRSSDAPIAPLKAEAAGVIQIRDGFAAAPYDGSLVQMDGEVVDKATGKERGWLLRDGAISFRVSAPPDEKSFVQPALFRAGDRLRITGICVVETNESLEPVSFFLLPRSGADVLVVSTSWWSTGKSAAVIVVLTALCLAMLVWVLQSRKSLGRQSSYSSSPSSCDASLQERCLAFSIALGSMAVAAATAVLMLGHGFGVSAALRVLPGFPAMAPDCALCLAMLGLSLSFGGKGKGASKAATALSCLALLIAIARMVEYCVAIALSLDYVTALRPPSDHYQNGAFSPVSAICISMLGVALLLSKRRPTILAAQFLVLFACATALVNTVASLFGVRNFYGSTADFGMAVHTSVLLMALGCGILLRHPDWGVMRVITNAEVGGIMARRLLPGAFLIPTTLGWLRWQGQIHGLYGTQTGLAIFTSTNVIVFAVLIWLRSDLLNRLSFERRDMERNLRASESRFRATFEQAAVAIAHVNPDGRFIRVNEKLCELIGYLREELLAKNFAEITHSEDIEEDWENARALLNGHIETYSMDKRYRHKNGSIVWIRLTVSLVWKALGEPDYFIAVIEGIGDRKAAEGAILASESALREREQQMMLVFDGGGIGDFAWEIEKNEITAHKTVWGLYGESEPCVCQSANWFRERQHPDDWEKIDREVGAMLGTRQPLNLEFRVLRPDGTVRWITCRGRLICDDNGHPMRVKGVNIDITEQKVAELRARDSEDQFRALLNTIPQIVWTSRPDGFLDYYNDRFYEFCGTRREEEEGGDQSWIPILHPDDVWPCLDRWYSCVKSGERYEIEYRFRDFKTGLFRWYLGRALPVRNDAGEITRWFGTCTDIHEQKEAKQVLELEVHSRTEQLSKSLREKDTLLREVHHRVKNNLQIISSLLRMQADSMKDATAIAALKESQQRVLSMALIHERLYGSQQMNEIDFGEYTRSLVREIFRSCLDRSRQITSRVAASKVLLDIDHAIPCGLILNELVTNALKYAYPAGQSGEVVVTLETTRAGRIALTVSDQGVGLPENFNWKNTKSLGLPIVEVLAQQLDGQLSIRNEGGVAFMVEFPVYAKPVISDAAA